MLGPQMRAAGRGGRPRVNTPVGGQRLRAERNIKPLKGDIAPSLFWKFPEALPCDISDLRKEQSHQSSHLHLEVDQKLELKEKNDDDNKRRREAARLGWGSWGRAVSTGLNGGGGVR